MTVLVWRWPLNARKAHVYEQGDIVSLCNRWLFSGPDQPFTELGEKRGRDDCAECWSRAKAKQDLGMLDQ